MSKSELDIMLAEAQQFAVEDRGDSGYHIRKLIRALLTESDRADRAEARIGAGDSEWDSLAASRDSAVSRIELVQAALVRFEDGEIESLKRVVWEIDQIVNNTKDDQLAEVIA